MDNTTKQLAAALRRSIEACDARMPAATFLHDARSALAAYDAAHLAASMDAAAAGTSKALREGTLAGTAGAHTVEPWAARGQTVTAGDTCIRTQMVWGNGADFDESAATHIANARRIVACVNACAGIPTEQLEKGTVRQIIRDVYEDAR